MAQARLACLLALAANVDTRGRTYKSRISGIKIINCYAVPGFPHRLDINFILCEKTCTEDRPISERLQDVRNLSAQFGGVEAIPEESLADLQYTRHIEADNTVRLVPLERLAVDGLAATTATAPEVAARQMPFSSVTFEVSNQANFLGAEVRTFEYKLHRGLWAIDFAGNNLNFLSADAPARRFSSLPADIAGVTEHDGRLYPFSDQFVNIKFDYITDDALDAFREDDAAWHIDEGTGERLSGQESERAWNQLERLKSKLTDYAELDATFQAGFDTCYIDMDPASAYTVDNLAAFQRDVVAVEPNDIQHLPITLPESASGTTSLDPIFARFAPGVAFTIRRDALAGVLAADKFPDIAGQLGDCNDIPAIRATLQAALRNNQVVRDSKAAEKVLMAQRKGMESQDDINAFNVELQQLRTARKQDLRLLRGAAEYFELPRLFVEYAKKRIGAIQALLRSDTSTETATMITLDGRPDAQLDADPGQISGDCTLGNPLPFNTEIPAHNIKIFKEEEHVGNIYLLKTTADQYPATVEQPYPVWHLDAIQFPSYTVDHADFIGKMMSGLGEQAARQGVACITVNSQPHFISNYDYISSAVLAYLGVDTSRLPIYGAMEIPDSSAELEMKTTATQVGVTFPEQLSGYTQFQGKDVRQYVAWQNPDLVA